MAKYLMAIDQGTTSSRCIVFEKDGQIKAVTQVEFPQYFPENGWVEQEPREIWKSVENVMTAIREKRGIDASEIAAIGITNQRETTIVWDKHTGEPIYRAIVWQCRRTAHRIDELKAQGLQEIVKEKTGLIMDPYFSASKIEWILDHVEGAREKAQKGDLLFGTVDTWLMYKLTDGKVHATDVTNASRTMLYNIHTLGWDKDLLKLFHIPENMLPSVHDSSYYYGETMPPILGMPIPITGVAGDQQAALFGQTCFSKGDMKNTYGTGCFLLMNTGNEPVESKHGLLTTIAIGINGEVSYALEGSVFVAGAAIKWLRDDMGLIDSAEETETLANSVNDSNGVYVIPAFTGLGAPYWDAYARGAVFGLTRGTKRAHFVRATLESLGYQARDVIIAMAEDVGTKLEQLRVDGGASSNEFLLQFQADILDAAVIQPEVLETTALGAAYLAGLQVGYYKDLQEIKQNWKKKKIFYSDMEEEKRKNLCQGWKESVDRIKS